MSSENLRQWFLEQKRDLPWRHNPSPYAVWVSEIMLQQTQVTVVIPYFQRWMERFPSIEDLAKASEAEVLKLWEGLGYYSRARNLHKGAKYVQTHFGGTLPSDKDTLGKIPGIGPYTVGAIKAFAFKQKAAAIDGNVLRVLSRYFLVCEEIDNSRTQKEIRQLAEDFIPETRPWEVAEALIELGATVCKKTADCIQCPLQTNCLAFQEGLTNSLPRRKQRPKIQTLYRAVPVILSDSQVLLRNSSSKGIMSGLAEFPYWEVDNKRLSKNLYQEEILSRFGISVTHIQTLSNIIHGFTRYKAFLYPEIFYTKTPEPVKDHRWVDIGDAESLAFSSGHKKILKAIKETV